MASIRKLVESGATVEALLVNRVGNIAECESIHGSCIYTSLVLCWKCGAATILDTLQGCIEESFLPVEIL